MPALHDRADVETQFRKHEMLGPVVQPHGVFVAGRQSFEVTVRSMAGRRGVIDLLFSTLPLEEHGWIPGLVRLTHIGHSPDMWPIYRLEQF